MTSVTNATKTEPLKALTALGQSIWLDNLSRHLLDSGELATWIKNGLRGLTSNPAILEKALAGSKDYDSQLKSVQAEKDLDAKSLYEQLTIKDIQKAADLFADVYKSTSGEDGFVSMEVAPYLANDTEGTLAEARRLWAAVNRPNLMIKVPGTDAGLPAIKQLISEGINVNVTLLFSEPQYESVLEAYVSGLEARHKAGQAIDKVASVASFFVSRIDSSVDALLDKKLADAKSSETDRAELTKLQGTIAVANAKMAYQHYKGVVASERWAALAKNGARVQRVLWASTGVKNPKYKDVRYVDELIGKDTVNTVPPATLDAFVDHGTAALTLEADLEQAKAYLAKLAKFGISLDDVTAALLVDGIKLFEDAFDKLLANVEKKRVELIAAKLDKQTLQLPEALQKEVDAALADWQTNGKVRRLYAKDASLWTNKDESKWLGWLDITAEQRANLQQLLDLQKEIKDKKYKHAVLLGMGGSSLGPEVLRLTFGSAEGFPQLLVLDSTDPEQISTLEAKIDVKDTVFIVSSKSGSTLEPNIFKQYFFQKASDALGAKEAGAHFIAVTDPGSHMEAVAKQDGFAHIFYGRPSIGGRYSVLSNFGMVPAAVLGIDLVKFLGHVDLMVNSCADSVPATLNPGVILGAVLGTLANKGMNKVTFITSSSLRSVGSWLEQLLAESTGKQGKGIVPVDLEPLLGANDMSIYSKDRLFVHLKLAGDVDRYNEEYAAKLVEAGQPVVTQIVPDVYSLGQEFFRWEIATAVAGAVIGINAFDQPDVEASKIVTKELTSEYEKNGSLPKETPFLEEGGLAIYPSKRTLKKLEGEKPQSLKEAMRSFLLDTAAGDYLAFLAYIEMNESHEKALTALRGLALEKRKVATCLGFGPRFLHSTGQAYKGGPNSGVFLQITAGVPAGKDLAVPDQKYTFNTVKLAQARGDFEVLSQRDRRAMRIHLGDNADAGLQKLAKLIKEALA
ncbi:MAG: bifunctional transaldolase/phosoglucose isomerase [Cyanobacteria bacterium REEB67]|nr:bifunctional transaldolase/phosoglucose isomerase [Cyanobacteria bacterium REEB67]